MGETLSDKWVKLTNVQDMLTPLHEILSHKFCCEISSVHMHTHTHTHRDSLFPMTTSHTPKKRPPPVAPKPTHHSTHTTSADTAYQLLEDPSSFLDVSVCVCVSLNYYTL